ncbi:tryptophan 2,3-dioxygenase [Homoserinimonas sp. OAct 916]|uniref:tryptophan 2,3-dioxygenase n=1 Tax=Homoserinimonas sp. OAct 916 TaxID=2211450 RepID=UPI000DBE100E|nr:tryptophan 2,3-dioxygenase family protein [Homoserinimonas sp. OAct 916]
MTIEANTRTIESDVVTDFSKKMSYGSYLHLDELLSAQVTISQPVHHDEMLFIIQHQTSELWLKLVLHELRTVRESLMRDDLGFALKGIARVKHIQKSLTEQWSVLATLTPTEYSQFRDSLGNASGFQSYQYRAVEFMLGNKNAGMLPVFASNPEAHEMLETILNQTSIYEEFLRFMARQGFAIPERIFERDVSTSWTLDEDLVLVFKEVYENADTNWQVYEACEELVDLEDNFQLWRFRHLKTVTRIIGMKRGTGGSSGAAFLQKALELTFFPELFAVRTIIGR